MSSRKILEYLIIWGVQQYLTGHFSNIKRRTYCHLFFYTWDKYQQAFFSQLASEGKPLILGGDGRADSPGHSAKFGTYSMIELTHNIVLDVQIIQV